jgi:hypothetical protein
MKARPPQLYWYYASVVCFLILLEISSRKVVERLVDSAFSNSSSDYRAGRFTTLTCPKNHSNVTKSQSPDSPDDRNFYWCVITRDSLRKDTNWNDNLWGWNGSIQHSAEGVLPCWSWFRQQGAKDHCCGILIMEGLAKLPHVWTLELIRDYMKCTVEFANNLLDLQRLRLLTSAGRHEFVQFNFRDKYWMDPRDFAPLRDRVFGYRFTSEQPKNSSSQVSIGIVQRRLDRRIDNIDAITETLREKGFQVDAVTFWDGWGSLLKYAKWYHNHDVIIAVHGCDLTNSIFIRPHHTVVIHLYPPKLHLVGVFEALVAMAGGYNLEWFKGDPSYDFYSGSIHERKQAMFIPSISPPVDDVISLVEQAVQMQKRHGSDETSK